MVKGTFKALLTLLLIIGFSMNQMIDVLTKSPSIAQSLFPSGCKLFLNLVKARIYMWGKKPTFKNHFFTLRPAGSPDGCSPYGFKKPKDRTAYFVNTHRDCPITTIISNAQNHGAEAVFIRYASETNLQEMNVPDHIPGVHIHVFFVSMHDGEKLSSLVNDQDLEQPKLEIDFLAYASQSSDLTLSLTYAPDDMKATQFLHDIFESKFTEDVVSENLKLVLGYTMLHCEECEKKGFKTPKPNCLSGGKYCMESFRIDHLNGEVMLVQVLKNVCTERVLTAKKDFMGIANYYWTFHESCVNTFEPKCSNAILKSLNIKKEVFDCINGSFFEPSNFKSHGHKDLTRTLMLDNSILNNNKKSFDTMKDFSQFPLLKINGMVYYGEIAFNDVFSFVCNHVNQNFQGCSQIEIVTNIPQSARIYKFLVLAMIILMVVVLVYVCRNTLKAKFNRELSYKIDQSVSEYLKKSGGSDL